MRRSFGSQDDPTPGLESDRYKLRYLSLGTQNFVAFGGHVPAKLCERVD